MAADTNNISTETIFSIKGLLDALRRFNAKERFFLVGHFLGNPKFTPDPKILEKLQSDLNIPKEIFVNAPDKFCAMDYHLDWLNGALELAFLSSAGDSRIGSSRVTGTQEDIDLLLAFDTPSQSKRYHIVLVEAKGVTTFSNSQLESKMKRLNDIFFVDGGKPRFNNLEVHLVLAAPSGQHPRLHRPSKPWNPIFLDLPMPDKKELLKITLTDDSGKPTKSGSKWKTVKR
jgi:hypothetical protein